jgi:hypothetical protein
MAMKPEMTQARGTATVRRIRALEQQVLHERSLRVKTQQELAGYRSACRRLQAALAQRKADQLAQQARVIDVEEMHPV